MQAALGPVLQDLVRAAAAGVTRLPLDDEAIVATVRKTNRVLLAHEDTRTGGVAAEITARINELCFEWLDAPVRRMTIPDVPTPYNVALMNAVLPDVAGIADAIKELVTF